jgi:hypothetical protein
MLFHDSADWIRLEIVAWMFTPLIVVGLAALLDRLRR